MGEGIFKYSGKDSYVSEGDQGASVNAGYCQATKNSITGRKREREEWGWKIMYGINLSRRLLRII